MLIKWGIFGSDNDTNLELSPPTHDLSELHINNDDGITSFSIRMIESAHILNRQLLVLS